MVLIKKIFFIVFLLFCFWPLAKVQAKLAVINTDFYKTVTIDNLTVTLVIDHPVVKQWVVELLDQGDYQELGIYPSNQTTYFTIKSAKILEYSIDAGQTWQLLLGEQINKQKIWLRSALNQDTSVKQLSELSVSLPAEQVDIQKSDVNVYPENIQLISEIYEINSQIADYKIKFYYNIDSQYSKNIYKYDDASQTWQALAAYNNIEEKYLSFSFQKQDQAVKLAIFQDPQSYDGIASFYNQARYRSFAYKNGNFAASRIYPKGTKLKITRLLTGKSIVITVNDYGPEERTGRLLDLDTSAFKQLGSTKVGVIYVKVELYDQNK